MENNVVTLETAKKLKAAGLEIDSPVFGWQNYEGEWVIHNWDEIDEDSEWYIAFLAQEIMDELISNRHSSNLTFRPFNEDDKSWLLEAEGRHSTYYVEDDSNIAELAAGAWLKLNESTKEQGE